MVLLNIRATEKKAAERSARALRSRLVKFEYICKRTVPTESTGLNRGYAKRTARGVEPLSYNRHLGASHKRIQSFHRLESIPGTVKQNGVKYRVYYIGRYEIMDDWFANFQAFIDEGMINLAKLLNHPGPDGPVVAIWHYPADIIVVIAPEEEISFFSALRRSLR